MSKARTWSLTSKWKLGKTLEDYKEHKINKKQNGAGYLEEKVRPSRSKKKFPCQKLKGEHNFKLVKIHESFYPMNNIEDYVCEACGKKKMEFIKK